MANKVNSVTELTIGAFDLETSGVDVLNDRIVTANFTWIHPDGTYIAKDWLVNPGVEIPEEAAAVHGVSTEYARAHGMDPRQALIETSEALNTAAAANLPVVGHNVSFDMSLLKAELRRHNLPALDWFPVVDTMVVDKAVDKYRKGPRKLEATAKVYGVTLDNAHTADADALAAGLIFRALARKYPKRVDIPLPELHAAQIKWRREQQESLEDYLRRKNNDPTLMLQKSWPDFLDEIENQQAA